MVIVGSSGRDEWMDGMDVMNKQVESKQIKWRRNYISAELARRTLAHRLVITAVANALL